MAIMPKGQSPKLKGTLWSIPVKYVDVSSLIPRTADSNGLVIVKLKKVEYRGHVLSELVQTRFIVDLLSYLKRSSHLYKDITIAQWNIPQNLQSFVDSNEGCNSITSYLLSHLDEPIEINLPPFYKEGAHSNLEMTENPLDIFIISSNERTLISNFPNVEPDKEQRPMSVLNDDYLQSVS